MSKDADKKGFFEQSSKMPVKIFVKEDIEIHMMGDYVGVRWNKKRHTARTVEHPEPHISRSVVTETWERNGEPYIGFYWIRERAEEWFLDEDSPVAGGITIEMAAQISKELQTAIVYLLANS